jgi:hypothetical protein
MRGAGVREERLFTTRTTAAFVPADHPPIGIRRILNQALRALSELLEDLYVERGRRSVPPARRLRGQLHYNKLFR